MVLPPNTFKRWMMLPAWPRALAGVTLSAAAAALRACVASQTAAKCDCVRLSLQPVQLPVLPKQQRGSKRSGKRAKACNKCNKPSQSPDFEMLQIHSRAPPPPPPPTPQRNQHVYTVRLCVGSDTARASRLSVRVFACATALRFARLCLHAAGSSSSAAALRASSDAATRASQMLSSITDVSTCSGQGHCVLQ